MHEKDQEEQQQQHHHEESSGSFSTNPSSTESTTGNAKFKRLSLKMRQQSKEEDPFNFKSRLKKTNVNPDEIKPEKPAEERRKVFDFRSVLRKRKDNKDKQSKKIVVEK